MSKHESTRTHNPAGDGDSTRQETPKRSWLSGALLQNPVLVQAIGLTAAVIAATDLRAALWTCAISVVHLVICEVLAAAVLKRLPDWLRVGIYSIIGMGIVYPLAIWMETADIAVSAAMRVFLPLLALNSLVAVRCERYAITHTVGEALRDSVANGVGFTLVAVVAGAIREILGRGTLLEVYVSRHFHMRGFWMPFGGFLLLGAMAALLKLYMRMLSNRGRFEGAEEAMDLAPEDRIERLEKARALREAQDKEELPAEEEASEAESPAEEDLLAAAPLPPPLTPEELANAILLEEDLEALLRDIEGY